MTVEGTITKARYEGNGEATAFPVPFAFEHDEHVKAVLSEDGRAGQELVQGVDYSLSGAGEASGGTLTAPLSGDPHGAGTFLTVYQEVPITQERAWSNAGALDAREIEAADDRLTRICQQLQEQLGRCLMAPVSDDQGMGDEIVTDVRQARDDAETARDAAQTARDEAQAAASSVDMGLVLKKADDKATQAQAQAGTDDAAYMTPAKVAQAIAVLTPDEGVDATARTNIALVEFRRQADGAGAGAGIVNGWVDEYEDQTGIASVTGGAYIPDEARCDSLSASISSLGDPTITDQDWTAYLNIPIATGAKLKNNHYLTKAGFYHTGSASSAWELYVVERTGTGAMTIKAKATGLTHNCGGWQDFDLPYFVPASGDFYIGLRPPIATINMRTNVLNMRKQSFAADPAIGASFTGLTEGTANGPALRATHVDTPSDMTLASNAVTAEAQPEDITLLTLVEPVDAVILNTDIKGWVSRDGGSAWTQITLEDLGDFSSGVNILSGEVDVSGQPTGTSCVYKITTHNNKHVRVHAVAQYWRG